MISLSNHHDFVIILTVGFLWLIWTRKYFFPTRRSWERVSLLAVILLVGYIVAALLAVPHGEGWELCVILLAVIIVAVLYWYVSDGRAEKK